MTESLSRYKLTVIISLIYVLFMIAAAAQIIEVTLHRMDLPDILFIVLNWTIWLLNIISDNRLTQGRNMIPLFVLQLAVWLVMAAIIDRKIAGTAKRNRA